MRTKENLDIISKVAKAVDPSDISEGGDCLFFSDGQVGAFDGRISIVASTGIEGRFAVKASDMVGILKRITSSEFTAKRVGDKVRIVGGRVKSEIAVIDSDYGQNIPEVPEDGWDDVPDNFTEGLKLCALSTSDDYSTPILCNVFVDGERMYSSDDNRASRFELSSEMDSFLLPSRAAAELCKMDLEEWCLHDNGIFFACGELVYRAALSEGEFPSSVCDKFVEVEGDPIKLPSKLKDAVETASVFSEADFEVDRRIKISIDKKKIVCTGEKDSAWASHTLKYKYGGDPISFSVNPNFFLQILQVSNKMIVGEVDGQKLALFSIDNVKHAVGL